MNSASVGRSRSPECGTGKTGTKYIKQVSAVPYTISGKKVELAVTQMIHNEAVLNRDALANPASLDQYKEILT